MAEQIELKDQFVDVAGGYARLLVLVELAGFCAASLGETEISTELSLMETAARARLRQLANEVESR